MRSIRLIPSCRSGGAIVPYLNRLPDFSPTWNIAPTQDAMVVRRHPETGDRHLDLLQWGLLPYLQTSGSCETADQWTVKTSGEMPRPEPQVSGVPGEPGTPARDTR